MKFTENEDEVEKIPDVTVKVVIQQSAEIDKELVKLMDGESEDSGSGDFDDDEKDKTDNTDNKQEEKISPRTRNMIELQEKQIQLFESVLDIDREQLGGINKIESLLEKARESLKTLKEKGSMKKARKEAHHRVYMKSRG